MGHLKAQKFSWAVEIQAAGMWVVLKDTNTSIFSGADRLAFCKVARSAVIKTDFRYVLIHNFNRV